MTSRLSFHELRVEGVEPLTADSVRITLAVPDALRAEYAYTAGQHLTVRHPDPDGGRPLRRSYSLCEPPSAQGPPERLAIAVKRHGPGGFGDHAVRKLAPGDRLDVLTPVGNFHPRPAAAGTGRHIAVAAGSGITPVLAILGHVLGSSPDSTAALLYGNRTAADVMFAEEIADLKDRYGPRVEVLHVLSREDRGSPLLAGRIDRERLPRLLAAIDARPQDVYYLCGPYGLVQDAREVLAALGARDVVFELFDSGAPAAPRTPVPAAASAAAHVRVTLAGRTTRCELLPQDESLLAAVLRDRPEAPYACTGGVCGTCRAKLTSGTAVMARDYALEPEEKTDGFVLTCQSLPTSAEVSLDFDA